jgi:hypothetical protein
MKKKLSFKILVCLIAVVMLSGQVIYAETADKPVPYGLSGTLSVDSDGRHVVTFNDSNVTFYLSDTFEPYNKPVPYRDASTGITLSVESDGRHVVATNDSNETMWRADPFSDAKLTPYRTAYPRIVYIGPVAGWMSDIVQEPSVSIGFDSSQFGIIVLRTGEFIFQGQD